MKRVLLLLLLLSGAFLLTPESNGQISGLPNRWNTVAMADLDTGLVGPASFTIGDKTYLVGGDTSEYYGAHTRRTRTVWCYDHVANTWSRTTPFPGPIRMGAVAFGATSTRKGYYGLGFDTAQGYDTLFRTRTVIISWPTADTFDVIDTLPYYWRTYYRDWWEFDENSATWTQKNDFPVSTYLSNATEVAHFNGLAYASGFSIDTNVSLGGLPRKFAGGFIFGQHFTGPVWDSTRGNPTPPGYGDLRWDGYVGMAFNRRPYFYDAANDAFVQGPNIPGPGRSNGVALVLDGDQTDSFYNPKLYAGMGEYDNYNIALQNIFLKDWYSLDLDPITGSGSWVTQRPLPDTGKANPGGFKYEHYGYIVCGFDGEYSKHHFLYNTSDEDWLHYPDYRDTGRSLGAAWSATGPRGYYGGGFTSESRELKSFSWYTIDTTTIKVESMFAPADSFCAGTDISLGWYTRASITPGTNITMQISDKDGIFEFPITSKSLVKTEVAAPNYDTATKIYTDTITGTIPKDLLEGRGYKLRVITNSPPIVSRNSDTFVVLSNPKFDYYPKLHPFVDTVCLHADHIVPAFVSGSIDTAVGFTYKWLRNDTFMGDDDDTLNIIQAQYSAAGVYTVVAQGLCISDTSEPYFIDVDSIPPPKIIENLTYQTAVNDTVYYCEFDTATWSIRATGKDITYRWYWNNQPLDSRTNIIDLGKPTIYHIAWQLKDSGAYKIRVTEECGSYVESDTLVVKMREIPRIVLSPLHATNPAKLEGDTVGFKVVATGYDLNYKWRKDSALVNNSSRVFGADTDSLTITNLIPSDVAFYSCIVCGGCPDKCDTSNLAVIDLNASPVITKQPADTLRICEGTDNVISIIASGNNMRYQWRYKNGTPAWNSNHFSDSDTRILKITNAQVSQTGYLECVVDNQAGAFVVSQTCYLLVIPTPGKPKPKQLPNLSRLDADTNCEQYFWFYNGVWKGQYNTKIIGPIPNTENGDYTVRVICNGCPSEMSDPIHYISSVVKANLTELEMYPNPATHAVVLDLPGVSPENKANISVFDLSGKLVMALEDVESESYEVNIAALSKGMYVVHVYSPNAVFSGKLVKE